MNSNAKKLQHHSNSIIENHSSVDIYQELAEALGGTFELKGFLFNSYWVVEIADKRERIESFEKLRPWFISNVIPLAQERIDALLAGTATPIENLNKNGSQQTNTISSERKFDNPVKNFQQTGNLHDSESATARARRWALSTVLVLIALPYSIRFLFTAHLIFEDVNRAASFIFQVIFGTLLVGGIAYIAGLATGSSTKSSITVPEVTHALTIQPIEPDTKECPYCAETIKARAIKCRYCGSNLPKEVT